MLFSTNCALVTSIYSKIFELILSHDKMLYDFRDHKYLICLLRERKQLAYHEKR